MITHTESDVGLIVLDRLSGMVRAEYSRVFL